MSVPVAALLAAAIYQKRSSLSDADELDRTVRLLAAATDGAGLTLDVIGDDIGINGTPLSFEAPGVAMIRHALVDHYTVRLTLPPALSERQWQQVVELYASPPGLYGSVDELRDAIRFAIPDAVISSSSGSAAEADLRQSLFELPGLRASGNTPAHGLRLQAAELLELSAQLDPLLRTAAAARDRQDYHELAEAMLRIHDLASQKDTELAAIIVRERRRVVPAEVLNAMARMLPKPGTPGVFARVFATLGHDGAVALLGALNAAHGLHERRVYIDALVTCRDSDKPVVDALGNTRAELVRDAAEVVGRKRMTHAVPMLAHLLRHAKVDVRTTAWHSLEMIGTPEAMRALRK